MANTAHYYTCFEPNGVYHIYNRTVDKKPMFTTPANYYFFLDRIKKYLLRVAEVYAYNLLGNHFHLLIRIRPSESHNTVSNAFRKMFQSYAMSFNKQEKRVGTLFQTPFKRIQVTDPKYFNYLVWYIHANAQLHGLMADFRCWPHGSYPSLISDKPTLLLRNELFNHFGGVESFIAFHNELHEILSYNDMPDD